MSNSKVFKFFDKLFKTTCFLQTKLIIVYKKLSRNSYYNKIGFLIHKIFFVVIVIYIILCYLKINAVFLITGVLIILGVYQLIHVFIQLPLTLVSLRDFMKTSSVLSFSIAIIVATFFKDALAQMVVLILLFGVLWTFFSLLANSKVASLANSIIAGTIAILTIIINTAISIMPSNYTLGYSQDFINSVKSMGYTFQQFLQLSLNVALLPLLIINGLALMLCQLKRYWLEKYYNDKEISWEDIN